MYEFGHVNPNEKNALMAQVHKVVDLTFMCVFAVELQNLWFVAWPGQAAESLARGMAWAANSVSHCKEELFS